MRVLFLMFAFPDMNKSFNMYTTIVEEFVNNGHEVVVVAPGSEKTGIQVESNIAVLRVRTLPIKNVPNVIKGGANLLLPYQFKKAINKFYPTIPFDLIVAPTPPITLINLAAFLKAKYKSKFYLILRDIFPQNAVDLGFIKKDGLLHRYFRKKEEKLYKQADLIGCMSPANIAYVKHHNPWVRPEKLHELKNFQKEYKGYGNDFTTLREKYSLGGKYVVVFGGNMGKPQQLENVLELARGCQDLSDVLFLLLGEGVQMQKLAQTIQKKKLTNIRIQGTIPKLEYQDLLSVCDVGLISLNKNFTIPNIPSKVLDYFNVGLPVLASIDKATDFGNILEEANAGLWSVAEDHQTFKQNFDLLYHDETNRKRMGHNGRIYFQKYLIPEVAYKTIIEKINND